MNHLLAALRDPHSVRQLSPAQWDLLVRQTRHANLLGRLYERLCSAGLAADIPRRPRKHLQAGAIMATQQQYSIRREARLLRDALAPYEIPPVSYTHLDVYKRQFLTLPARTTIASKAGSSLARTLMANSRAA